jgi:hypothetical protein
MLVQNLLKRKWALEVSEEINQPKLEQACLKSNELEMISVIGEMHLLVKHNQRHFKLVLCKLMPNVYNKHR